MLVLVCGGCVFLYKYFSGNACILWLLVPQLLASCGCVLLCLLVVLVSFCASGSGSAEAACLLCPSVQVCCIILPEVVSTCWWSLCPSVPVCCIILLVVLVVVVSFCGQTKVTASLAPAADLPQCLLVI